MTTKFPTGFGATLAIGLLLLYGFTVAVMIVQVVAAAQANPSTPVEFSSGLIYVVTTVGGLVSALVISRLTITQPGENPGAYGFSGSTSSGKFAQGVVVFYGIAWMLIGSAALVVGVMMYPEANQTLNDLGTVWLGIAVASGYAYFGIKPTTR